MMGSLAPGPRVGRGGLPGAPGMQRGGRGQGRNSGSRNNKDVLKFDGDYDFEEANAKFEKDKIVDELSQKLKITDEDKPAVEASTNHVNGDAESPKENASDVNENEAVLEGGDIENEDLHDGSDVNGEDEDEDDSFYNKTRSFFDNISCEATERLKGGNRPSWREERALNSETFGAPSVAAARRFHHGRHGRGGWRGGGGGGYRRGGGGGANGIGGQGYRHGPPMYPRNAWGNNNRGGGWNGPRGGGGGHLGAVGPAGSRGGSGINGGGGGGGRRNQEY